MDASPRVIRVWCIFIVVSLCTLLGVGPAHSGKRDRKVNPVELAGMLMSDGHYDRAQVVLDGVDVEMLDDEDIPVFRMLQGLTFLYVKSFEKALEYFNLSIEAGQKDTLIYVYVSQSHFGLKQYEQAVEAFEKSGHAGRSVAEMFFLWSSALYELGRIDESWDALEEGEKAFPKKSEFLRQKFLMMVRLGFYQAALELGRRYVDSGQKNLTDYLALASALTQAGQSDGAREILEQAALAYPNEEAIWLHLSHNYLKDDANYPAADLMQRAAHLSPEHLLKAAEIFRKAGFHEKAIFLNAQVTDQAEKLRQRISLLLDKGRFEEISLLHARANRLGLLKEDNVAYAVAYAHFQRARYSRAKALLAGIQDARIFQKAVEIRKAIEVRMEEEKRK